MEKVKHISGNRADMPVDDDDNPELTTEDFSRGRPFKEVFPKQHAEWEANGRAPIPVRPIGRPPAEQPKVQIGFRLSQDVVARIRASGAGYNARVEKALRDALDAGRF
jgi:uncharacterized protein (DUF4415 family)